MEKSVLNLIRSSLKRHQANLLDWLKNGNSHSKAIHLGLDRDPEVPVTKADVPIIERLEESLDRIESGEFGTCIVCREEVEVERLMLDFTTSVCLDHYSEFQLRELERDLELAARVQRHLLPGSLPAVDGVQIAVSSRPAGVVGGDYYDFFRSHGYWQGLAIADVMGKGISASMLMANLQASLRILGSEYDSLGDLAERLNQLFSMNLKQIRFISLFLATLDPKTHVLHYTNAGHHPPLRWNSALNDLDWLKPTGPAIGLNPAARFRSEKVKLQRGDLLVLYTDGLVEARNNKDEFGAGRLADYVRENRDKPVSAFLQDLLEALQHFAGQPEDDLTVMVLKVEK